MGLFFKSKEQKEFLEYKKKYGNEITYAGAKYLGGHYELDKECGGLIDIYNCGLLFNSFEGNSVKHFFIPVEQIKNVEMKNNEQITQDISVGRVVLFGAVGAIAKKTNVHEQNYIILACEENGINYNVVFESKEANKLVSNINKIRIEASR